MSTITLQVEHRQGDLFDDIPEGAILVHACNARGVWGTGVARTFRELYASAFKAYEAYCKRSIANTLLGKAMLIPVLDDSSPSPKLFIGCLFTRVNWGAPTPAEKAYGYEKGVLEATETAMQALVDGIAEAVAIGKMKAEDVKEIRMPRINSGRFNVQWEDTEEVLKRVRVPKSLQHLKTVIVFTS